MNIEIKTKVRFWLDKNFEYKFLSILKVILKSKKKKISVVFYLHARSGYLTKILLQLLQSKEVKPYVYFLLIIDSKTSKDDVSKIRKLLKKFEISFDIYTVETYWKKVLLASHSRSNTIIKWDEDIYMSSLHASNLITLVKDQNWSDYDVLSPIISTGIPSCEYFFEYYMDEESARKIRLILQKQEFSDWWDSRIEYKSLNNSYDSDNWRAFFSKVSQLKHPYKGMHPIRINKEAQEAVNEWILTHRKWENWSPRSGLIRFNESPYFCNSIFSCSPNFLRLLVKKVKRGELFFDGYDEIALNGLLDGRDRKIGFIANSLAVHPSYNSIGLEFEELSKSFFERI